MGRFVTYGAVDDIRRIVTSGQARVSISVIGDLDHAIAAITNFDKSARCAIDNSSIICELAADDEHLADLNSYLVGRQIKICSFNKKTAGLEDVFMKITAANARS
jgi:hypothetical protein